MYLQVERDTKVCRVPTVNVSHYIKLAEIPSHLANDQERLGLPGAPQGGRPTRPAGRVWAMLARTLGQDPQADRQSRDQGRWLGGTWTDCKRRPGLPEAPG